MKSNQSLTFQKQTSWNEQQLMLMPTPKNQVLSSDAQTSANFYRSDVILRHYLGKHLPDDALHYMGEKLDRLGNKAATAMDALSLKADKMTLELQKRSKLGEAIHKMSFIPPIGLW